MNTARRRRQSDDSSSRNISYEIINRSRRNLDDNVKDLIKSINAEEPNIWERYFTMNNGLSSRNKRLNYIKSRYWNILNTKIPDETPENVEAVLERFKGYIGSEEAHIRMMLIDHIYQCYGYTISKEAKDYESIKGELSNVIKTNRRTQN